MQKNSIFFVVYHSKFCQLLRVKNWNLHESENSQMGIKGELNVTVNSTGI